MILIKILVATTTFPRWKGDTTPSFVYDLTKRLQDIGFEVVVLAPHYYGAEKFEIMDSMRVYRFSYFYPLKYQKLCYNGGMLPNLRKSFLAKFQLPVLMMSEMYNIFKIIKNEKIDLIHAHWIIPSGLLCSIAKIILRKKLIISVHGSDISLIKHPFFKFIGKQILRMADTCTVNSAATKNSVLSVVKLSKEPIIIPMGVDLNIFQPFKNVEVNNNYVKKPCIMTVGRLDKKKGINYLIDAMPKVIHKFPDVKLVIVGEGPEKDNLINQIKMLSLEGNIYMAGAVQNKELPKYYNRADLFVLPSLEEGLGVVLLEAMACGTPVIGSDVGGIPDVIIDGKNGFLFKPRDSGDITEKILDCLSNETLLRNFSISGLSIVAEKFCWTAIAEKFSDEYMVLERCVEHE